MILIYALAAIKAIEIARGMWGYFSMDRSGDSGRLGHFDRNPRIRRQNA